MKKYMSRDLLNKQRQIVLLLTNNRKNYMETLSELFYIIYISNKKMSYIVASQSVWKIHQIKMSKCENICRNKFDNSNNFPMEVCTEHQRKYQITKNTKILQS